MVTRAFCLKFFFFLSLVITGCTDLLLNDQTDGPWLLKQKEKIAIYYRPASFSKTPSPSDQLVDTMLTNQNYFYNRILDTLKSKFSGIVMVYLYNYDEAKQVINTNGGGYGSVPLLTYHITYYASNYYPVLSMGLKDKIGAHELVHILADNVFGPHGTKLFSEGLAVCIDNTYGGRYVDNMMPGYYNSKKILTINSMLNDSDTDESLYYPNAGTFIKFFITNFGMEKVKALFTIPKEDMEQAFLNLTGKTISEIQLDYEAYCRNKFQN